MKQNRLSDFTYNKGWALIIALFLALIVIFLYNTCKISKDNTKVEPIYFIVEKDEDSTTLTIPKEYHLQFDEHGACTLVRTDSEESK